MKPPDASPFTTWRILPQTNNQCHRLGESGGFSLQTVRTRDGGRFVWTSPTLEIVQDFTFVASRGARLANGIQQTVTIRNRSEEAKNIGVRFLLDTTLGETQPAHFLLDGEEEVTREQEVTSGSHWISPSAEGFELGLFYAMQGQGISRVSRVVFGNWKRLIESSWDYPVRESRTFSLLPYSINDSAAAMYYGPQSVAPGDSFQAVMVMGAAGSGAFAASQGSSAPLESLFSDTVEGGSGKAPGSLVEEVVAVNDLLAEIDALLSQEGGPSGEDVEVVRRIYEELRRRAETARSGRGDRPQ